MEMKVCVEKTGGLMVLADTFSQVRPHTDRDTHTQGGREGGREGGRGGSDVCGGQMTGSSAGG